MIKTSGPLKYTKEPGGSYMVRAEWWCATPILGEACRIEGDQEHPAPYVTLGNDGRLTIADGYLYDGPSGPTYDTRDSLSAALAHDGLYQLMRARKLSVTYRKDADVLFHGLLRQNGMGRIRARFWYWGVRWFAAGSADPQRDERDRIAEAP